MAHDPSYRKGKIKPIAITKRSPLTSSMANTPLTTRANETEMMSGQAFQETVHKNCFYGVAIFRLGAAAPSATQENKHRISCFS